MTVALLVRPSNGLGLGILALSSVLTPSARPPVIFRRIALLVAWGAALALPVFCVVARAGVLGKMWRQFVVFDMDYSAARSAFGRLEPYAHHVQALSRPPLILGLALAALLRLHPLQGCAEDLTDLRRKRAIDLSLSTGEFGEGGIVLGIARLFLVPKLRDSHGGPPHFRPAAQHSDATRRDSPSLSSQHPDDTQ